MFLYPVARASHVAAQRAATARHFGRAIDRLFDESTDRLFGGAKPGSAARTPALDVRETGTTYVVAFDVPGATRDQLKVTIEGRRLNVETTVPAEGQTEADRFPMQDAGVFELGFERMAEGVAEVQGSAKVVLVGIRR